MNLQQIHDKVLPLILIVLVIAFAALVSFFLGVKYEKSMQQRSQQTVVSEEGKEEMTVNTTDDVVEESAPTALVEDVPEVLKNVNPSSELLVVSSLGMVSDDPQNPEYFKENFEVTLMNTQTFGRDPAMIQLQKRRNMSMMRFIDGRLYFTGYNEDLVELNLETKGVHVVGIPGLQAPMDLRSLYPTADRVYYLQGGCAEVDPCSLKYYDRKLGSTVVVLENVYQDIPMRLFGMVAIYGYENDKLQLSVRSGDGGAAMFELYEVDIEKKRAQLVGNALSVYCGGGNEEGETMCTEEEARGNQKYNELVDRMRVHSCGDTRMLYHNDGFATVLSDEGQILMDRVRFVDCIKLQ